MTARDIKGKVSRNKLRVPIGKAVFSSLRSGPYVYVDKTRFIPVLESLDSTYPVVLRPRRFGKSLFMSMLESYYDRSQAADFERNFKGTYIYDHCTDGQGQYYILHFDFSGIDMTDLIDHVTVEVKSTFENFLIRYGIDGREEFLQRSYTTPADWMTGFCQRFEPVLGNRVLLLVDECDQLASELLFSDPEKFREITSVHEFLKNFYAVIKKYADKVFPRLYLTGVTSISLDSMTSGFSIATNYSTHPLLAEAFGLTDEELRQVIHEAIDCEALGRSEDALFGRMKELYNGYRFDPKAKQSVCHTSLCMAYLRHVRDHGEEPEGSDLLDSSVAVDLSKIHGILSLGNPAFVRSVVERCLRGQTVPYASLSKVINLNQQGGLDNPGVLTTLLFFGYLTFAPGPDKALACPNKTMLEQFFGYYFKYLSGLGEKVEFEADSLNEAGRALSTGDLTPFLRQVEKTLQLDAGLHSRLQLSEAPIQFYLLGAARTLHGFRATAEEEALGVGFSDVLIRPTSDSGHQHSYLVEIKYLTQANGTEAAVQKKLDEACVQLAAYAAADNVKRLPGLKKAAVVFVGPVIKGLRFC